MPLHQTVTPRQSVRGRVARALEERVHFFFFFFFFDLPHHTAGTDMESVTHIRFNTRSPHRIDQYGQNDIFFL